MAHNEYEAVFVSLPYDLFLLNPVYLHAGSPSAHERAASLSSLGLALALHLPWNTFAQAVTWLSSRHLSCGGIIPWSETSPLAGDAPLPARTLQPCSVLCCAPRYWVSTYLFAHLLPVAPPPECQLFEGRDTYCFFSSLTSTAWGSTGDRVFIHCLLNLSFQTSVIWALGWPCLCHICTRT